MVKSLRTRFNWQLFPIQFGIIVTLALIPIWYRFPHLPDSFGSFGPFYGLGFIMFWPMLWTVVWWLIMGMPGLRELWHNRLRLAWAAALFGLIVWAFLSWIWAYTRDFRPEIAIGAAIPFGLSALFSLVMACAAPRARVIIAVLVIGLILNGLIAGTQVAIQGSIDLGGAGFQLDPQQSGTAVVEADGIRWLRPYGLLPHPNILGGFFAICLLAVLAWVLSPNRRLAWAGIAIFLFGLYCLFLTFSRSAWLGFAAGAFTILPILWRTRLRDPVIRRRFITTIALSLIVAGIFFVLYRPFLSARALIVDESVEERSISDRIVFSSIGMDAINSSPILGVGIGNFPWYASAALVKTDFDLQGMPAHHVFLVLGGIGCGRLHSDGVGGRSRHGSRPSGRRNPPEKRGVPPLDPQSNDDRVAQIVLLGGTVALMIVGLLDHYPWTLMQFEVAWWGLLGVAGRPIKQALKSAEVVSQPEVIPSSSVVPD